MRILTVEINNFRNLTGVKVAFGGDCNFIVGENNLGKSNILSMLNTLFNYRAFSLDDFNDPRSQIEVQLKLALQHVELGHFQDLFSPDSNNHISIICRQPTPDDNLLFIHLESGTSIPPSLIKSLNFVHYDSNRNPTSEINFSGGKGVGRFLRSIVSKHLIDAGLTDAEFLDSNKMDNLLSTVNTQIKRIKAFGDFGIKASKDSDAENLLSKIVVLDDRNGRGLTLSGYGVQFLILITLSVLEKIQTIQQYRGNKGIFEDESTGKKFISLILALDEPEIHLHPYMQRSLIKYFNSVIANQNSDFSLLVKELFGLDGFIGQILIVTHSPSIILNEYRQIIRLFRSASATKVISGSTLNLPDKLTKHLHMQFPFFKEAFFSRCVIIVEGECEHSSFPLFAQSMNIELDDLGISVIQAHGSAVVQLMEVAIKFGIPAVGISDRDGVTTSPSDPNLHLTTLRDFDDEIVHLMDVGKESLLRQIVTEFDPAGADCVMQQGALNKHAHGKYGIGASPFTSDIKLSTIPAANTTDLKAFYLTWFSTRKSYPLGHLIGTTLKVDEIPTIYKTVINKAKTLSENV